MNEEQVKRFRLLVVAEKVGCAMDYVPSIHCNDFDIEDVIIHAPHWSTEEEIKEACEYYEGTSGSSFDQHYQKLALECFKSKE